MNVWNNTSIWSFYFILRNYSNLFELSLTVDVALDFLYLKVPNDFNFRPNEKGDGR